MKKRLLSAILSFCMLLTMAPTVAFAAEGDDTENTSCPTANCTLPAGHEGDCNVAATPYDYDRDDDGEFDSWNVSSDDNAEGDVVYAYVTPNTTGYTLNFGGSGAMKDFGTPKNAITADWDYSTSPWGGYMNPYYTKVTDYYFEENSAITHIGQAAFYQSPDFNVDIVIPESVTSIGQLAFVVLPIRSVQFPDGLTNIGNRAFERCPNLTSVDLSNTRITNLGGAFNGCTNLSDVKLPSVVTTLGANAFKGCTALTSIELPNSLTNVGQSAFQNAGLTSINLNNAATLGSSAFRGCTNLTSVDFGKVTSIPWSAFAHTGFVSLTIPENITVGVLAFAECQNLKEVTIYGKLNKNDYQQFQNCPVLETVNVQSNGSIPNQTFKNCVNLKNVTIGEDVTDIGSNVFNGCTSLHELTLPAKTSISNKGLDSAVYKITVQDKPEGVTQYGYLNNAEWHTSHEGATLEGWYFSDGTCANDSSKRIGYHNNKSGTMYAVFSNELTFDANGGTGTVPAAMTSYFAPSLSDDDTIALTGKDCTIPANTLTKDGHVFIGWNTKADGTGVAYANDETLPAGKNAVAKLYAQWGVKVVDDIYFVYPTIEDQTYTGSGLKPEVKVTKNNEVINKGFDVIYVDNTDVGQATATVKVGDEVIGTATFNIVKATPEIAISATPDTLTGGGSVELTVTGVPSEGTVEVTCDNGISVTATEPAGKYTAQLPNATKDYIFTAKYTGTDNYNDVEKSCKVSVTHKSSSSSGGSSSSSTPSNTVSASTASNGTVALDKSTAKKGDTVTVTVTPDAGYQLDKLTITDAKGKTIAVTKKSDSKYTFTMPDSKVTITPAFSKIEDTKPSKNGFVDVASSAWYADAVQYVTDKGLMNGTGNNKFSPSASTTRGMLMTVLARYAGADTTGGATWYEKGMNWAKAKGVSDGTNPTVNITREQLVTMLYRYAGSPKADGKLDSFSDAASVSSYAVNAMQWAVANGIVNGSNGKLNPQNNATRAEVAAILMRFCEMSK